MNEQFLESILENVTNTYFSIVDRNMTLSYLNGGAFKANGLDPAKFEGKSIDKLFYNKAQEIKTQLEHVFKGERVEFDVCRKKLFYRVKAHPFSYENGEVKEAMAIVEDVTTHKKFERDLEESEARFRALIEHAPEAVYINSMDGTLVHANQKACESLGYSIDELLQMKINEIDLAYPSIEDCIGIWELMESGKNTIVEGVHVRKDKTSFPVEVNSTALVIENEKFIVGFVRDLSEHEEILLQLRQNEKMRAMGQLAGGIAHDFNNMLGGILGYAEISLYDLNRDDKVAGYMRKIIQAGNRAKLLVKQILTFSHKDREEKEIVYLRPIVKEVMELMKASIPSSVVITSDLSPDSKPVLADGTKIHEVLMNLCTNAAYAMDNKGHLTVQLYEKHIEESLEGLFTTVHPGDYSVIEVADTGRGIPQGNYEKIFEPFFTTKGMEEGTGMGLSVVLGVVQSHGGAIQLDSEVGVGTKFKLYLPKTGVNIKEEFTKESAESIETGIGNIVIVDDDKNVLDVMKKIVASVGYQVRGFAHSHDALSFIRENHQWPDLIIADYTMPYLTGVEMIQKVRYLIADLPVILCTGNTSAIDQDEIKKAGIEVICDKPVSRMELAKLIKSALSKKNA